MNGRFFESHFPSLPKKKEPGEWLLDSQCLRQPTIQLGLQKKTTPKWDVQKTDEQKKRRKLSPRFFGHQFGEFLALRNFQDFNGWILPFWATEVKNRCLTCHYIGWFKGTLINLIMAYHNPYVTGWYNPLHHRKLLGIFRLHVRFQFQHLSTPDFPSAPLWPHRCLTSVRKTKIPPAMIGIIKYPISKPCMAWTYRWWKKSCTTLGCWNPVNI